MTKKEQEREILKLKLDLVHASEIVANIREYLLSKKFHNDPTVQTQDVLRRLERVTITLK